MTILKQLTLAIEYAKTYAGVSVGIQIWLVQNAHLKSGWYCGVDLLHCGDCGALSATEGVGQYAGIRAHCVSAINNSNHSGCSLLHPNKVRSSGYCPLIIYDTRICTWQISFFDYLKFNFFTSTGYMKHMNMLSDFWNHLKYFIFNVH